MKISTEIGSAARRIGEEKTLEYLGKAGFDAWDFSMHNIMCKYDKVTQQILADNHPLASANYLAFARRLKSIGLDYGMVCNQSHAPFPTPLKGMRLYLKRAIECTAEAGGEICVIHPGNRKTLQENTEMYFELLPFAKECGVKIAVENMWNWNTERDGIVSAACSSPRSFVEHLNAVNDEYLVACLDIGHAEMGGLKTSAVEMIYALGNKLQAIHMHDNDKVLDSHCIPFAGKINFVPIMKALKECNYQGYMTLEADQHFKEYSDDNILYGFQELAESARKLVSIYESY